MAHKKIIDDTVLLNMLKEGKTQKDTAVHFKVSTAAICKRLKRLSSPSPESIIEKHGLTERQAAFAIERAKGKNATQAAMVSYEASSVDSAKSIGSQLMKQPEVISAIEELMNVHGLTKDYRIRKLKTLVDNRDPNIVHKALDMSWRLDGSYVPEKPDIEINYNAIILDARKLRSEIERIESEIVRMGGALIDDD